MRTCVLAVALAALILAGCDAYEQRERPFRPAAIAAVGDVEDGETLYQRDCAWCHGARGQGTNRAPNLIEGTNGPALTHFVLTTGRMPLNFPEQRVQRSEPAYDEDRIEAIVSYVESFGQEGPDIPDVDLEDADLQLGLELYQENCAACHSTTGAGGALGTGDVARDPAGQQTDRANVAPELDASTPTEVAEAMLTGPGTMPVFGHETFSDEQIDGITRYVVYLQNPENRGGAGIGGIGPVAEGAVGWIVGLGLLLLFVRVLGTRTGE